MVSIIFEVIPVALPFKSTYPNRLSLLGPSCLTVLLSFYFPSLSFSLKHLTSCLTTELKCKHGHPYL